MAPISSKSEATPPLARDVIQLYADSLADIHFPDLDLSVLEAAVQQLHSAQDEVARIEAELESARAAMYTCEGALRARAERGLAYAQVFAEGDAALAARVALIGSGKAVQTLHEAPPEKRKRRKRGQHDAGLFGADGPPPEDAAADDAATETAA